MNYATLQGSATLIIAFIILILMVVVAVIVFSLYRRQTIEIEESEYELAMREAMRRQVGISESSESEIARTLAHLSRNRIGAAIIIEGRTQLEDIEDTGDSFGFGKIKTDFLNTILSSVEMGRGAVLIRRDHIVAYNCKMPIIEQDVLIRQGAGKRHLGAFGTMMKFPDSVVLTVSGTTGKISIFGHLGTQTSIDFGLQLRETDVLNGVTESELEYRIHSLVENSGLIGDLNSEEIQREIEIKNETRDEKRERIARERQEKEQERDAERKRRAREQHQRQMERDNETRDRDAERRREKVLKGERRKRENKVRESKRERERRRKLRGDDL